MGAWRDDPLSSFALTAIPPHGIELAASAASAARGGPFDPASTLPWAVPMILIAPVLGYVLILSSVRTRRAAANVALLTVLVMLAAVLLVGWARFRQTAPYNVAYQWINLPVAFTGDQRFQGFGIDLAFRVDRVALAALIAMLLVVAVCLAWHRVAARGEQGPVRYQVNALMLALGAAGVLVSGDLAEMLAFWFTAGLATYLLLGHRWGTDGAGLRGRLALAVPFVGDMALLCGVAILYSRFGTLDFDKINPVLTGTVGVGLKSLTTVAVLIVGAVAVRACVWPFTAWQTGTVDAPIASLALAAGVWPILAGVLLLRSLPLLAAAGPQARLVATLALAVAAVVGPLLALVGVEVRRSSVLASSGAVALTLLGLLDPGSLPAAFMGVLAVAAGRAGILLAAASAASAMRTVDLRAMGGAWQRMPATALGLLLASVAITLGGVAAALRPRSLEWVPFAAGLALVAFSTFRAYTSIAHGELRRRRAFEPARVREAARMVTSAATAAGVLGLVAALLAFLKPWAGFLLPALHPRAAVALDFLWLLAPLAGGAAAALAFRLRRDASLDLWAGLGDRFAAGWELAGTLFDRFLTRPGRQVVGAVEDVGVPAVETSVSRALIGAGRLADRRVPWVPTLVTVAVVLVVVFGLLSQELRG